MTVDLDAGVLRDRIIIQRLGNPVSDGEGGFTETWSTVATVWAGIRPMRASQIVEYKSLNVHATHLVEVRGEVDIQETDQMLFGSRVFEVLTVENEREEGVRKWVTCKERRP